MSDERESALATLRFLLRNDDADGERLVKIAIDAATLDRLRPLLEPSDAERKLDEIRAFADDQYLTNHGLGACVRRIFAPPRVPQVGDTVRDPDAHSDTRVVLAVYEYQGQTFLVVPPHNGGEPLPYKASEWEVVE